MITIKNLVDAGWNKEIVGLPYQFNQISKAEEEAELQAYISGLENTYEFVKQHEIDLASASQTALGKIIEKRIHEIAKELGQPYETTCEFVKRVFQGLPANVKPGSVPPYEVEVSEPQVITQKLNPVTPVTVPGVGQVSLIDTSRKLTETADRSQGVPDITV